MEALVEQPGADVCTQRYTVELVTSSQDSGSTLQQLLEETEELRMSRVSNWMMTQQAAINEAIIYLELSTAIFDFFSPQ